MLQLINKLNEMRFYGMAKSLEQQIAGTLYDELSFKERFEMLTDGEYLYRKNRQLQLLLTKARFRYRGACLEEIDFRTGRGITKSSILELAENRWIRDKRNLIVSGPTGTGKTYICCAIGNSACRSGIKTMYVRLPRLLQEIRIARADGTYINILKRLSKIALLIIDDWGLAPFSDIEGRDFLEVMEDRYNIRSTMIVTQFPVDKWHEIIGDPTIADAICDRLVHNAYHIKLTGDSMRKIMAENEH